MNDATKALSVGWQGWLPGSVEDAEDDDPAGGNCEDEGESIHVEGRQFPLAIYAEDQRIAPNRCGPDWNVDREARA